MSYSELNSFKFFENKILIRQYGRQCFISGRPELEDVQAAIAGFEETKSLVQSGEYHIVILDEITIAVNYNLLSIDNVLDFIKNRPEHVEIVMTGRYADNRLFDVADLITEMCEVKHYFKKGVDARIGIEK